MKITKISKSAINPSVWDGGETFEYFIFPGNSSYKNSDFLFRISVATITKAPSTFTKFNGYERFLVMLDNRLSININGKEEEYSTNDVFNFDSNSDTTSYTKGNDFNVMVRNDLKANVCLINDHLEVAGFMVFVFAKVPSSILVNTNDFILEPNDLLVIENPDFHKLIITTNQNIIIAHITKKSI